jgi:hypothetical protein
MNKFVDDLQNELQLHVNLPLQLRILEPLDLEKERKELRFSNGVKSTFYSSDKIAAFQYYKPISKIY